ncbi:MAG: winged helix-turn-helix transcriptional regulator [Clostridiales bacterium]|nr:winged helix-turn-helix transcriptional regulator [Clostridiales bacterium]
MNQNQPIKSVLNLHCVFRRIIERQMADLGLSSIQSRMLGYLQFQADNGKQVFQSELEEEFKIRKSSVTSVLQILEKKGLMKRVSVKGDARRKELLLTAEGQAMQKQVKDRLDALERQVRDIMTPEEQQMLLACVQKIETRLKEAEYD